MAQPSTKLAPPTTTPFAFTSQYAAANGKRWFTFNDPCVADDVSKLVVEFSIAESASARQISNAPYGKPENFVSAINRIIANCKKTLLLEDLSSQPSHFVSDEFINYGVFDMYPLDALSIICIDSQLVSGFNFFPDGTSDFHCQLVKLMQGRISPSQLPLGQAALPFEYKTVIFPVNTPNAHWSALVYYATEASSTPILYHYDSAQPLNTDQAFKVAAMLDRVEFFHSLSAQRTDPRLKCKVVPVFYWPRQVSNMCGTWVAVLCAILAERALKGVYKPITEAECPTAEYAAKCAFSYKTFMWSKFTGSLNAFYAALDSPHFDFYPKGSLEDIRTRGLARARDAAFCGQLTLPSLLKFIERCIRQENCKERNRVGLVYSLDALEQSRKTSKHGEIRAWAYLRVLTCAPPIDTDDEVSIAAPVLVAQILQPEKTPVVAKHNKKTLARLEDLSKRQQASEWKDYKGVVQRITLMVCVDKECVCYSPCLQEDAEEIISFAFLCTNSAQITRIDTNSILQYGMFGALRILKHVCAMLAIPPTRAYAENLFPQPSVTAQASGRVKAVRYYDRYVLNAAMAGLFSREIEWSSKRATLFAPYTEIFLKAIAPSLNIPPGTPSPCQIHSEWKASYSFDSIAMWLRMATFSDSATPDKKIGRIPLIDTTSNAWKGIEEAVPVEHQKIAYSTLTEQSASGTGTFYGRMALFPLAVQPINMPGSKVAWLSLQEVMSTLLFAAQFDKSWASLAASKREMDDGISPLAIHQVLASSEYISRPGSSYYRIPTLFAPAHVISVRRNLSLATKLCGLTIDATRATFKECEDRLPYQIYNAESAHLVYTSAWAYLSISDFATIHATYSRRMISDAVITERANQGQFARIVTKAGRAIGDTSPEDNAPPSKRARFSEEDDGSSNSSEEDPSSAIVIEDDSE